MKKKLSKESLFEYGWRPAVGWAFIFIILFDFMIAPSIVLSMIKAGIIIAPWSPLTLDSNGFFYLAIATILGAAAWTHGQEKIEKIRHGYDFGRDDDPNNDPGPPL